MRSLQERRRDRNKEEEMEGQKKKEPREKRLKQTKFDKAVLVFSITSL